MASTPPKSSPAEYTKFFVENAISWYETQGLDATLAHHISPQSVDGQWYVFIIDKNDLVVGHPEPHRLGLDVKGWVGTDANGYRFGLSDVELKNVWVVRHDDLLFASGWYIDVDQFTQDIVAAVVDLFGSVRLEGIIEVVTNDPASILGGVASSEVSYNTSGAIEGE